MSQDDKHQDQPINWLVVVVFGAFHIGAVASLFMFSWQALCVAVILYWVAGSLGIGMGYHRLLTHRGYKTPKPVEYFLSLCGTLAVEGGPANWVVTHRIHHRFSDQDGDPHSPRDGGWWAHMGWILVGRAQEHPPAVLRRYAPDLMRDPIQCWLNRLYIWPIIFLGVGTLCTWWVAVRDVGTLPASGSRPSRHLAGELGDSHVGNPAFRNPRRFPQQLVGRLSDFWRGLAQQPSRAPDVGSARTGVV